MQKTASPASMMHEMGDMEEDGPLGAQVPNLIRLLELGKERYEEPMQVLEKGKWNFLASVNISAAEIN